MLRPVAPYLQGQGIRPINTRTDLPALADLLEVAFAANMDANGRMAIQHMREAGRLGFRWLSSQSLASGVRRSLVWVEDGRLLGNLSQYSADLPYQKGKAWILANIAVLPAHRRRGIATELIAAALEQLKARGENYIVLQVDEENESARQLYRRSGFIEESIVGIWTRSRKLRLPSRTKDEPTVSRQPKWGWRAEYELAKRTRPPERGGIGWLRPLNRVDFGSAPRGILGRLFAGRMRQRRIVMGDEDQLKAVLWLDRKLTGPIELTLLHDEGAALPELRTLLRWALQRYPDKGFTLEHPSAAAHESWLAELGFRRMRTVVNMRFAEADQ